MKLHDKSILITGAGSGIGRATALALARKGARLVLSGRRQGPLEETARLAQAEGSKTLVLPGDVTDATWRDGVVNQIVEYFGGLDILINCAGVVSAGRLQDSEPDDVHTQIEVNLLAPILLIRSALPALRRSSDAAIVNVSSSIGLVGMPFYTSYAASKGGLAKFSEALRRELSDDHVQVMTVYPGATDTPMMETAKSDAGDESGYETPEAVAKALVAGLEAGDLDVIRGGEDFAALVQTNQQDPRKADRQIEQKKAGLESRAAKHRSM
ncbi:MAG: SDR family NAD(P)-dependent oxidoreductase [Rhodanobacter sp.]|nr:MAG: SDR family NAD(P)-dependent oxidoreductase [Rhodanobacter sp.]